MQPMWNNLLNLFKQFDIYFVKTNDRNRKMSIIVIWEKWGRTKVSADFSFRGDKCSIIGNKSPTRKSES